MARPGKMQVIEMDARRDGTSELDAIVSPWPNLVRLIKVILACWPEHAGYLRKSFAARSASMMATSDHIAGSVLALAGNRSSQVAEDYRWLGDRIREEEIEFARTGHYRYSSFEQTNAHVYSDDTFMEKNMHAFLFGHVLWYRHESWLH